MNLNGVISLDIPHWLLLALILAIVAFRLRANALENRKSVDNIFKPVGPSLNPSPSPWAAITNGVRGCFGMVVYCSLMVLALTLAVFLLLGQEQALIWLSKFVP